ncbi:hypothetical protein FA13DRAFT_1741265 [Coprinellus micaceus]|uniref:Uncharacterized protein n=1 Tax=Coprinellus micaceus TaxID=71717 RepID=A0A4Y7SJK5_COPMI|nr:hypothetical protein FA13DRAFT_1741265 [Coprinellus micaceus]
MPIPVLPLEVWLEILEVACLMDTKVPIALSEATRELRNISRFHRFHSVKIDDEEKLLAFEKQFSFVPEDIRRITNLLVILPSLLETAYTDEGDEADDSTDASYASSSTHSDNEGTESDDGSHAPSLDSEDELEYEELSTEEYLELRDEDKSLAHLIAVTQILPSFRMGAGPRFYWTGTLHPSDVGGKDLSQLGHLASYKMRVMDRELDVYSALRRVLEIASGSLKQFSLYWEPHCDFNIDALFPVLPNIQRLTIFEGRAINQDTIHTILQQKFAPFPPLFPSLLEFNISNIYSSNWGGTSIHALKSSTTLRSVSLPCKLVQAMLEFGLLSLPRKVLPTSVQTLRAICSCISDTTRCKVDVTGSSPDLSITTLLSPLTLDELKGEWEERRWFY